MSYLRYRDDIELGEQRTMDGVFRGMTVESRTVEKREHHLVRLSHAKSSACVMRARSPVCEALSDLRHRENGVEAADTASIEEIPA